MRVPVPVSDPVVPSPKLMPICVVPIRPVTEKVTPRGALPEPGDAENVALVPPLTVQDELV